VIDQEGKQGGFGALVSGLARAFQWRILVVWAVGLSIPTFVATLPVWQALSARLDHSVRAADIAQRFDLASMIELTSPITKDSGDAIAGAGIASFLLALLIAPWLTGMAVASIRAGQALRFGTMLQMGLREYGRMLRMLLWAAIPLGVALGVSGVVSKWADKQAGIAILASGAENARTIATIVLVVLFVLAHATVEAGRGVIAADPSRRSVVKAWWRGLLLLVRRPISVLVVYLGTALAGYGLALAFAFARTQVGAGNTGGLIAGVLLVQFVVASIAFGRIARLYGFASLVRDTEVRRQRASVAKVAAVGEVATPAPEAA
jgi:hypothetical protein